MLIEPVTWADRGEWKCEFPDADIQSSPGKLNVDIPLTGVSFSSNGREYTNSTRGAPLVIDEGDDLTIWCRTSETFPSPKGLEIWIENEKLKNVQIQTHTKSDGMAQMSGACRYFILFKLVYQSVSNCLWFFIAIAYGNKLRLAPKIISHFRLGCAKICKSGTVPRKKCQMYWSVDEFEFARCRRHHKRCCND